MEETPYQAAPEDLPRTALPAGLWRRGFAYLIDILVLVGFALALTTLVGAGLAPLGAWDRSLGSLISLAYFGVGYSALTGGRTLGKRALGLAVTGLDGAPLTLGRALARSMVGGIPALLMALPASLTVGLFPALVALNIAIGVLMLVLALADRRQHRTLHDVLVGSIVVRHAGLLAEPPSPPRWGLALPLAVLGAAGFLALMRLPDLREASSLRVALIRAGVVEDAAVSVSASEHGMRELHIAARLPGIPAAAREDGETPPDIVDAMNGIATLVLDTLEQRAGPLPELLTVQVSQGTDLGLWQQHHSYSETRAPEGWDRYSALDDAALQQRAEAGDADAQYQLALRLSADAEDWLEPSWPWLRSAADGGQPQAQAAVGDLYQFGIGVPVDAAQAFEWYRRAAEQDDPYAQFSLGYLYMSGLGVRANRALGLMWTRRALDNGYDDAMAINNIAWTLVTAPEAFLRDAEAAEALMQPLIEAYPDDPIYLDTWAAVHAEDGDWTQAESLQQQALGRFDAEQESLGGSGAGADTERESLRAGMLERLNAYRARQPWREH